MVKDPKQVAKGKKNRASGAEFEKRVRIDLTKKGWIVDKWGNNIELRSQGHITDSRGRREWFNGKLIQAKNKWAGPGRPMMMGAGFPDFIAFSKIWEQKDLYLGKTMCHCGSQVYQTIIGVECKCNGYLTKEEKEKCRWLLDNHIFSKILIAEKTKVKNKIVIVYHNFEEKYG